MEKRWASMDFLGDVKVIKNYKNTVNLRNCMRNVLCKWEQLKLDCMTIYTLIFLGISKNQSSFSHSCSKDPTMSSGISHRSPSLSSASFGACFILKLISHPATGTAQGSFGLIAHITSVPVIREHVLFLRFQAPERSLIFPPWHTCPSLNESFCLGGFGCYDWLSLVMCLGLSKP